MRFQEKQVLGKRDRGWGPDGTGGALGRQGDDGGSMKVGYINIRNDPPLVTSEKIFCCSGTGRFYMKLLKL